MSETVRVKPSYRELQSNVYETRKEVRRQWEFFSEEEKFNHSNNKRKKIDYTP